MSTQTLAADTKQNAAPGPECRVYERHSCEIPTKCHPVSILDMQEAGWHAAISDLSQGGVRLKLARRFERGTGLAVDLPGDDTHDPSVVFVKVVHIRPHEDGGWMLGCRFVSELSDDEMYRLLTSKQEALPPRQEKVTEEPRGNTDAGAKFLSDVRVEIAVKGDPPLYFRIKRLDVTNSWPIAVGKVLRVNGISRDEALWSFEIEVLQLQPRGNGWQLCSRLAQPEDAANLRQAFGRVR